MSADRGEDHHYKLNYELMYTCLQTEVKIITPNSTVNSCNMSADRGEDHHTKLNSELMYTCLQTELKIITPN
jgi:hypothetical protein